MYSDRIFEQHNDGTSLQPIKFPLQVMKPLGALIDFYSYIQLNPDIVHNGIFAAAITEVCNIEQ